MNSKLIVLAFLIVSIQQSFGQSTFPIYHNRDVENSQRYLSGNKYQKDLLVLISMMKETHPSIILGEYKYNIDSLQNHYYNSLAGNADSLQFVKTVRHFLCSFNDSHTGLNLRLDQSRIYPISLSCDSNRVYISGIQCVYENMLGKNIYSINGISIEELFLKFNEFLPSDNPFYFKSKINYVFPYYSLWEESGLAPADSVMLVQTTDGDSVTIKPMRRGQLKISFVNDKIVYPIEPPQKKLFSYSIVDSLKLCYFQFNSCQDRKTLRNYYKEKGELTEHINSQLNSIPLFDEFAANMFMEIKQRQIRTLVIDVRYNTGGNSILCDILLSWLKPLNQLIRFSTFATESSLLRLNYPEAISMGKIAESPDDEYDYNLRADRCFVGNVIVFQSEKTYSSAGMLVTQIRDNEIGLVVGTESTYSPSSYGDILRWKLPNTGIEGFVSYKKFIRPGSICHEEPCLMPDVKIGRNDVKDCYQSWLIEKINVR